MVPWRKEMGFWGWLAAAHVADTPTENEQILQEQNELLCKELEKLEERVQSLEDEVAYLRRRMG